MLEYGEQYPPEYREQTEAGCPDCGAAYGEPCDAGAHAERLEREGQLSAQGVESATEARLAEVYGERRYRPAQAQAQAAMLAHNAAVIDLVVERLELVPVEPPEPCRCCAVLDAEPGDTDCRQCQRECGGEGHLS